MKRLSDEVAELFVTTERMKEVLGGYTTRVSAELLDEMAVAVAVAYNEGIETGVKLMIMRDFEKKKENGQVGPNDSVFIKLLRSLPLAAGAEDGRPFGGIYAPPVQ